VNITSSPHRDPVHAVCGLQWGGALLSSSDGHRISRGDLVLYLPHRSIVNSRAEGVGEREREIVGLSSAFRMTKVVTLRHSSTGIKAQFSLLHCMYMTRNASRILSSGLI
jgi:hypothetical protein